MNALRRVKDHWRAYDVTQMRLAVNLILTLTLTLRKAVVLSSNLAQDRCKISNLTVIKGGEACLTLTLTLRKTVIMSGIAEQCSWRCC